MPTRKCAFHTQCLHYSKNISKHGQIFDIQDTNVESLSPINIKIAFHFIAPAGSYNTQKVRSRAYDIALSLNDDFNNYSANANQMNNFRYKAVVNQVFTSNMQKQSLYLGPEYLKYLPIQPSNITFEMGEVYYYPIKTRLDLKQYDDDTDIDMEYKAIKQYIYRHRSIAIFPENFLNVWVVDITNTEMLGYSSFPWDERDDFDGVVIHRRVFFPEDYQETEYDKYKTVTHEVGHYLGLVHVFNHASGEAEVAANYNLGPPGGSPNLVADKLRTTFDPLRDPVLKDDPEYNPLFMNFMNYTVDRYVTNFTPRQILDMRYSISAYRNKLNSNTHLIQLPQPKYMPEREAPLSMASRTTTTQRFKRSAPPVTQPVIQEIYQPEVHQQQTYYEQTSAPSQEVYQQQTYYEQAPIPVTDYSDYPQEIPLGELSQFAQPQQTPGGLTNEAIMKNIRESMPAYFSHPHQAPQQKAPQPDISSRLSKVSEQIQSLKTDLHTPKYNRYNQAIVPPDTPSPIVSNARSRFIRSVPTSAK